MMKLLSLKEKPWNKNPTICLITLKGKEAPKITFNKMMQGSMRKKIN